MVDLTVLPVFLLLLGGMDQSPLSLTLEFIQSSLSYEREPPLIIRNSAEGDIHVCSSVAFEANLLLKAGLFSRSLAHQSAVKLRERMCWWKGHAPGSATWDCALNKSNNSSWFLSM